MNIVKLQGNVEKIKGIYYEYDIDSTPLGEGGMGRVFKGFKVLERTGERTPVAIKAIYDNIPERVVERARREAEIQIDSDNLIRMYGFVETISNIGTEGKTKTHYHVIMELLVGVTLENIINGITNDNSGMSIPYAVEIYSQLIQNREATVMHLMKSVSLGLMVLHDKGFIHRDIDPSNIMVTIDRKIKLIDFGICKQIVSLESVDKTLTTSGQFMGKVNYAAPELVLGDVKSQNYTTDIYALGILLFQLSTGHLPFNGTDQEILSSHLRKQLPLHEVKNKDLRKIIRKSTEKVQSKRYNSVAEFRVDIERVRPYNYSKFDINYKKLILAAVVILLSGLITAVIFKTLGNKSSVEFEKTEQQSCEEIYAEALQLLNRTDSVDLFMQGKQMLKTLVVDSSYSKAALQYYVLLLNSEDESEVREGFGKLRIMAEDPAENVAMFECGFTLSKGNFYFKDDVPAKRQTLLHIEPDLKKANEWLYKAAEIDTTDYKSVYWALNNLIERKSCDTSFPLQDDKKIVYLYREFKKRIMNKNDGVSDMYRQAIKKDEETLKLWALI